MSQLLAFTGARIFDGNAWHDGSALLVEFGYVAGIVSTDALPSGAVHDRYTHSPSPGDRSDART